MFVDKNREIEQDWDAVERFLSSLGHHFNRDKGVRQFGSGIANLNYLIHMDDEPVVLRRPPARSTAPGAYNYSRQYRILSRLGRALPAVPRGLVFCEDESVIGTPFLICEYRSGIAIGNELPSELAAIDGIGGTLSQLLVEALVQLHRIDPAEVGLADLGKPDGFISRQIDGWYTRASRVMSGDRMDKVGRIRDWLRQNQVQPKRSSIIHLDFKLDNVLLEPYTLTINAVVDWELSTIGDSAYDMVMTLIPWGGSDADSIYRSMRFNPSEAPGWWSRRQVVQEYSDRLGISVSDDELKFYWVLCVLRTVVTVAQLWDLYAKGQEMANVSTVDMNFVDHFLDHMLWLLRRPLDW